MNNNKTKGDEMGRTINPADYAGKTHQVTFYSPKFAKEIADGINEDYPGEAFVKDGCCFVSKLYERRCHSYVLKNCKIKGMETDKWKK